MGIGDYEARIRDRAGRTRLGPPAGFPSPGNSLDFELAQNARLNMSAPWQIRAVGVANLTPFLLHFPDNPVAFQWVLPNTLNAVVPVPPTDSIRVNSIDAPPGVIVPSGSTLKAELTAFEDPLPPSPGIPYASSGSTPLNLSPNKIPFQFTLIAGANQEVIKGVLGQTIYIFSVVLEIYTAAAQGTTINFMDGSSGAAYFWRTNAVVLNSEHHLEGKGSPLTPGNGIYADVPGPGVIISTFCYSQG